MDKQFFELLDKAKNLKVIDEGSIIIFADYINRCEAQIHKNIEMVNRLMGKNEQLKFTSSFLGDVVRKYIRLQEEADSFKNNEPLVKEEEVAFEMPTQQEVQKEVARRKSQKKVLTEEVVD